MRRQIPPLHSLLCFSASARHLSYTHAAQELFMSQSAVSRQIQLLEDFLHLRLFHRTRHGVELTAAGQQYYKNIQPYLEGLERATLDVMSHKGLGGTLKIGVVPTFATRWLLPQLHDFNALYPEIIIHLETSTKPFLFDDNIFDAAIYAGTPQQVQHWPGTQSHFLMPEDLIAVCSPSLIQQHFPKLQPTQNGSYDLSPEQFMQLPLLQQTTRPSIWQEWLQSASIMHSNPYDGQRHELFSMLAVAATHGMGVALIPQMLLEKELSDGSLVITSQHQLQGSRSYYVVHSQTDASPLLAKFVQWLKTVVSTTTCKN
jgi:LysR family transcriptional regulator, glycine cleavage system transcriptional activator